MLDHLLLGAEPNASDLLLGLAPVTPHEANERWKQLASLISPRNGAG
jgi:hypothetical protein